MMLCSFDLDVQCEEFYNEEGLIAQLTDREWREEFSSSTALRRRATELELEDQYYSSEEYQMQLVLIAEEEAWETDQLLQRAAEQGWM